VVVQEEGLTGYALAGGKSRRMGRDKALLPYGTGTFLDHTLSRLRSVCSEVRILTGETIRYPERGVQVLTDPGVGPLGAILEGLKNSESGLFLAVDLPEIPAILLAHLVGRRAGHDAVVPVAPRGPQPLCAVYGPACRAAIQKRLDAGERRASAFLQDVKVRFVSGQELEAFGDPQRLFANVNTPEELSERLRTDPAS
jgi:molybdopterin-guanine dinucleotide biosynthesis protein A